MQRTTLLFLLLFLSLSLPAKTKKAVQGDREYWASLAYKMAQPVLENMAHGTLQKNMMTEFSPSFDNRNRRLVKDVINTFCLRQNKTLVMVSHYQEELPACIDHQLTLKRHV